MSGFAAMALAGLALDVLIGWPDRLYRRIGHPVTWLGRLVAACESRLNHGGPARRLAAGALTTALCAGLAVAAGLAAHLALRPLPHGWLAEALLCWPLLAARALWAHVAAVARPLARADLPAARQAVAMIVGRDVSRADAPAIARAATESLAENASDGIIAPLFWAAIAGLPGLAGYKAVNTLDSMIGHRNARYLHFGRVAARLDDVANLIPARLTALLFALASRRPRAALQGARREAGRHRSPNAGWPEAAMAHALGVRLSGPRVYGDRVADEPWLNGTAPDPGAADLRAGLFLFARATALAALILAAIAATA